MGFRAVLLDFRGTLVPAPTYRDLVRGGLARVGRPTEPDDVEAVLTLLRAGDRSLVDAPDVDTDVERHRAAHDHWFRTARLDDDLAAALYAVESDVAAAPFAYDVAPVLSALSAAGVALAVVSDIHVDLRPAFAAQRAPGGGSLADLVSAWVLSFEVGAAKPDPRVFRAALDALGVPAADALMVGDRGAWDGAAAEQGLTALVLPPLTSPQECRLHRVLDLALPR
ncbi:HAD family hydrolase [Cellulomonas sp. ACRRI]|uniref:HAD family hydrolase n=1 Tax=Cellulomonas sp. ACRRI TaxID=2918188 RepID=UPI001EF29CA8|nr:HAD family hydrolase [Cellulomonas sp. ACRRI]MCG7285541.1 HAD family hydrolase [Cellulomonas sp. ACRRI]